MIADHDLIARIHAAQSSWVAAAYPEHERCSLRKCSDDEAHPGGRGFRRMECAQAARNRFRC